MSTTILSIRRRLLECLDRADLVSLADGFPEAAQRGRTTIIDYLLKHWDSSCDRAVQGVVDRAKLKPDGDSEFDALMLSHIKRI
jgi:hypothetical protein